eukprot:CAMPEP_0201877362 /NCGR_PEP_ID=MMETSP0902-20130614/8792_1 /ASSEMBLY_ACC=CAM_ASM_000551 /TAXON_ID=420261 /ORGANISM="Thalassiosira antarctica, Strain CCMP982" /LENGTH=79 /DNA_ID=CAMNT_0048404795 /DNA_START=201 /DNA_END=440 /DNA_ORIENTATION=-
MSMINNPTYNLFAPSVFMASLFPPRPVSSPPPSPSEAQERFPPDARSPKACTPASPITPIVPPAARQEIPQQRPAAKCA